MSDASRKPRKNHEVQYQQIQLEIPPLPQKKQLIKEYDEDRGVVEIEVF